MIKGTNLKSIFKGLQLQHYAGVVLVLTVFFTVVLLLSCTRNATSEAIGADQQWAEREASGIVSKIRKEHPRIYLTPQRIQEIKRRISTDKKLFDYLSGKKKNLDGFYAALFYALGESKELGLDRSRHEYGRIAAEALERAIREKKREPDDLAVLYDWAFGALSDQEKKDYIEYCKFRLGDRVWSHDSKYHGYRTSPRPRGVIAMLSFYGDGLDDGYAKKLLPRALAETLADNLAMEQVAGKDGGFADGTIYFLQLGGTFLPFLAVGTSTDSNFFFEHEVMTRLPNHLLQAMLPFPITRAGTNKSARYFATFNDNWTATTNDFGSRTNSFKDTVAIIAAEYRRRGDEKTASLYAWFLKESFGGYNYGVRDVVSLVLADWSIEPKSPKELGLPLAEALGWDEEKGEIDRDRFGKKAGIGWVVMRSGWDDPDATFAIFKAEPFYYHGHMHRDSLAFMIAKSEELALSRAGNYQVWFEGSQIGRTDRLDTGWPQMANFFTRTISTSNLLVYNPAEKFDDDWKNVWANDGGQRLAEGWDRKWGREYNGTANGNYRDIGGLIRFERTGKYVYTAADATRAYNSTLVTTRDNPPKVSLVQRELVYLTSPGGDQDCFVIFDRVDAVKANFKKFWLLQLRAKPEFDGISRVAVGSESGGIHLSDDSSSFHVRQERAELFGKTLLPKDGNRVMKRLGGWITTTLKQSLGQKENGPLDIEVESTEGMPDHPVVIMTARAPDPEREIFDRFSVWPRAVHASGSLIGDRICFFCEGRTQPGKKPAKLLNCVRATKASPGVDMPAGARVIQEFRHMGVEGADTESESARIDYPWGYGQGYNYGDGNQYGLWRIEVSPRRPSKLDYFLHVLHPALKGKGSLKADLIESNSGNIYGAMVNNRAVIFSRAPEALLSGAYTFEGTGKVWQLLCNLKAGVKYEIRQDGKPLMTVTASQQGTASFESAVAGKLTRIEFAALKDGS